MRFAFSTPHQFQLEASYHDTLIISSHTGTPLDVAVPFAASEWISRELVQRLHDRYPGRTLIQDGGICAGWGDPDLVLSIAEQACGYPLRAGVWIVDRRLMSHLAELHRPGVRWLVWDWWQWLVKRVPETRLTDALFYLCVALPAYRTSTELAGLGLPETLLTAAAAEGERLWERMLNSASHALQRLWSDSQ